MLVPVCVCWLCIESYGSHLVEYKHLLKCVCVCVCVGGGRGVTFVMAVKMLEPLEIIVDEAVLNCE
jgi:hypothetical protein